MSSENSWEMCIMKELLMDFNLFGSKIILTYNSVFFFSKNFLKSPCILPVPVSSGKAEVDV